MIAVDIGNTKTAIGFFKDGVLVRKWRIATDLAKTSDQISLLLEPLLSSVDESLKTAGFLALASVVPHVTQAWLALKRILDVREVTHHTRTSFLIAIPDPSSLGPDRIADAEAAIRIYGAPVVIVDAGTALTISAINSKKEFIGGTITPGIGISLKALFNSAARLQEFDLSPPKNVIGETTQHAIESGVYFGYSALIYGLIEKFKTELDGSPKMVATGGSIESLKSFLKPEIEIDPDLTLKGLALLYG